MLKVPAWLLAATLICGTSIVGLLIHQEYSFSGKRTPFGDWDFTPTKVEHLKESDSSVELTSGNPEQPD